MLDAPKPEKLFHFTDAGGVIGILRTGTLRASHAAAMGDRSELSYSIDVARHGPRTRPIGDSMFRGAVEAALEPPWFGQLPVNPTDAYVASFCNVEESALVWLNYGRKGAGFALRFHPETYDCCSWLPVLYDRAEQEVAMERLLAVAARVIEQTLDRVPASDRGFTQALMSQSVAQTIWLTAAAFKDPVFHAESEYRLIHYSDARHDKQLTVEFRPAEDRIVPFVSLELPRPIPIAEVIVGYSNSMLVNDPALQVLWRQGIGTEPVIRRSTVPVRP